MQLLMLFASLALLSLAAFVTALIYPLSRFENTDLHRSKSKTANSEQE